MDKEPLRQYDALLAAVKHMTFSGKNLADKAFRLAHSDLDYEKAATPALINQASSYFSSAYAIYHSNYELLENSDIDAVFKAFFTFAEEMLDAFAEDHNLQWTSEYYDDFIDAFQISNLAVPIEG